MSFDNEVDGVFVQEIVDKDGNIIRVIRKFGKPIVLTGELEECIARHIEEMGNRNPTLVKRRSPLFPAYRNTRKIKRHLKIFGATYTQIHHAGIHYFYRKGLAAGRSKGWIYESGRRQKRISARQFQAIALNSKIPAGRSVDTRSIEEILGLLEEAQHMDKNAPDAEENARNMMERFEKSLNNIRNNEDRKNYEQVRPHIEKALAPHIK